MNYSDLIYSVSTEYGVDPALTSAVIQAESSFNPNAIKRESSGWDSYGLMQVTMQTAEYLLGRKLSVNELLDPTTNVALGARYLREGLDRYGNVADALAYYNSGAVRKNEKGEYINSQGLTNVNTYVNRVLTLYAGTSVTLTLSSEGEYYSGEEEALPKSEIPYTFYIGAGILLFAFVLSVRLRS